MIASSEVASAFTWDSDSTSVSAGTNRIPPPTPSMPLTTPAASAHHDREDHDATRSTATADISTANNSPIVSLWTRC